MEMIGAAVYIGVFTVSMGVMLIVLSQIMNDVEEKEDR